MPFLREVRAMDIKIPDRISRNPLVMSGHPCVRDTRVTVANVLRLLARYPEERILEAYPYLSKEDIQACVEYAAILADEGETHLVA